MEYQGESFVDQANALKEIYASSCKRARQAHARHAATLPAGRHVDLRFFRGFHGKLGRLGGTARAFKSWAALRPLTHDALDHHGRDTREHGLGYRG
jgi:hypothetical protein